MTEEIFGALEQFYNGDVPRFVQSAGKTYITCLTTIIFAGAVNYQQGTWMTTKTLRNDNVKTLYVMLYIAQCFTLRTSRDNAHPTAIVIVA